MIRRQLPSLAEGMPLARHTVRITHALVVHAVDDAATTVLGMRGMMGSSPAVLQPRHM